MYVYNGGVQYLVFGKMPKKLQYALNGLLNTVQAVVISINYVGLFIAAYYMAWLGLHVNPWYWLFAGFLAVIWMIYGALIFVGLRPTPWSRRVRDKLSDGAYRNQIVAETNFSYQVLMTVNVIEHLKKPEKAMAVEGVNDFFGKEDVIFADKHIVMHPSREVYHDARVDQYLKYVDPRKRSDDPFSIRRTDPSINRIQSALYESNRVIDAAEDLVRTMGLHEDTHFAQMRHELSAEAKRCAEEEARLYYEEEARLRKFIQFL